MKIAKLYVHENSIDVELLHPVTSGTVGARVDIEYDSHWSGMDRTIIWRGSGRSIVDIMASGIVPAEVVAAPGSRLMVGFYGTVDGTATPTIWADLGTVLTGADPSGDPSTEPSLPVWSQTKAVADQANAAAKEAKAVADQAGETAIHALEMSDYALAQASEAMDTANGAMTIAKGRATGYVFDTKADMDKWLWGKVPPAPGMDATIDLGAVENAEKNRAMLVLGDNLYIRDKGVPDYWWDGEKEQELETQKVDLAEYVKNTDYATTAGDKAGVVRFLNLSTGTYGIQAASQNYPGAVLIAKANYSDIDKRTSKYKPIVPYNLDYAVHSVLKKQPKFISSYTGDINEDGHAAANGSGDYIGQIRLQGNCRSRPQRVWMYIGLDMNDPEVGLPVWLDLLSGEAYGGW